MNVSTLLIACFAGAGAAAWVVYLRWKDKRRPEPMALLLLALVAGVIAAGAGLAGFDMLDGLGMTASWAALGGAWPDAVRSALTIGFVEETAKLLPLLPIAFASSHFDEIWDGPVYAGAAGVGFALAETGVLLAGGELSTTDGLARALASPITHALFAMPMGLGLAHAVLFRRRWALPLGLAISATAHAAYNLFLARPGMQLAAAGVVLVLWLSMLWIARDLVRRPPVPRP